MSSLFFICISTALLFIVDPVVGIRKVAENGFNVDTGEALYQEETIGETNFEFFDDDGEYQGRIKRSAYAPRFTQAEKDAIVAKHNEGRANVSPPAANMKTMVWDDKLADMARKWSKGCRYKHGHLKNHSLFGTPGQNLHIRWGDHQSSSRGMPNGVEATQSWYDENVDYNYDTNGCKQEKKCGHYTQNVWASTYAVGCGRTFCPRAVDDKNNAYVNAWLVTCNYGPRGNVQGQKPYEAGQACSKCDNGNSFCKDNLCSDCSPREDNNCECKASCKNCGTLQTDCTCDCMDGYYGSDCSSVCENTDAHCGANPGYPTSYCDHAYVLKNCPLMCGKCNARNPNEICENSYTLNEDMANFQHQLDVQ